MVFPNHPVELAGRFLGVFFLIGLIQFILDFPSSVDGHPDYFI